MRKNLDRRSFIKNTAVLGAAAVLSQEFPSGFFGKSSTAAHASGKIDLAAVKGDNFYAGTYKAVEQLGGIDRFVTRGARVGILVNCNFKNPGASVHPDIFLAVVKMCFDAGAGEIYDLKGASDGYWKKSPYYYKLKEEIERLKKNDDYAQVAIEGGLALKEAHVLRALLDCDLYINIPIIKHHQGVHMTCTLKNTMGASPYRPTLRSCHFSEQGGGWYGDVDRLSQSIADLNLVRSPDLCVVDATEFITGGGPSGPGPLKTPHVVAASTDRVALDAYCSRFLGLNPQKIGMITKAHQHSLGEIDPEKLNVKEMEI